jgi:hypothetical protein
VIEPTEEMVRAFAVADSIEGGLAAVLAIVERDYMLIPRCPNELVPGIRCLRVGHTRGDHEGFAPGGSTVKWS